MDLIRTSIVQTESDLRRIIAMIGNYQEFYRVKPKDSDQIFEFFRSFLNSQTGLQLLATDSADHELGFATLYFLPSSLTCGYYACLHDLFVAKDARGRGVGRALFEVARKEAQARGFTTMDWQTAKENIEAQKLYDSYPAEKSLWYSYSLRTCE